jgi:mono/diheme cytochrome c family protein
MSELQTPAGTTTMKTHGVLAEFSSPGKLLSACKKVRDAGYTKWDAHTPFPLHGLDDAMAIKPTRLPWIVFCAGITGAAVGIGMQHFMNTIDYPFHISGKPLFSLPANIPVAFEVTILFSAFAVFLGMFALNQLPQLHHSLFSCSRFSRATSDRFFIAIEAHDPKFSEKGTEEFLRSLGSDGVEVVKVAEQCAKLPKPFVTAGVILLAAALIPPLLIVRARYSKSETPRFHPVLDMDFQAKYKTQAYSPLFADHRASRPPVQGSVARGELNDDAHFYQGKVNGEFATTFPARVAINKETLARGQQRYNIHCAVCHGVSGYGDGIVAKRAEALVESAWVIPTSLHTDYTRNLPVGALFNSITHGVFKNNAQTMPPYGPQTTPADRWAILLYVRALERSQNAKIDDVPVEIQPTLK